MLRFSRHPYSRLRLFRKFGSFVTFYFSDRLRVGLLVTLLSDDDISPTYPFLNPSLPIYSVYVRMILPFREFQRKESMITKKRKKGYFLLLVILSFFFLPAHLFRFTFCHALAIREEFKTR